MVKTRHFFVSLILPVTLAGPAFAQDRFEDLPGHDAFTRTQQALFGGGLVRGGEVSDVNFAADGSRVFYQRGETWFAYVFETGEVVEVPQEQVERASDDDNAGRGNRRRGPGRGRQQATEPSPDGAWIAMHEDYNLILENAEDGTRRAVTTDGSEHSKYATGSWVYGEELRQTSAMWWSPDSQRIAFYHFNEEKVKPFYLLRGLDEVQVSLYPENYPKAGEHNPIVGLRIYDLEAEAVTTVDVGDDTEQYIFNIRWSPDGEELLFNQTNRHQNVLNVMAADPETGDARTILTETQETWQQNNPMMRFLADGERFVWETERSGWKHYELRHIDGSLINPLTSGEFPCDSIIDIDEESGWVYFYAYSSETPLNRQLHRVRLDGTQQSRLSPDDLSYNRVWIAPDDRRFVAMSETIEVAPSTAVYDMQGHKLATIAESDTSAMNGRPGPEMFTFKAEDGVTDLYGVLHKPSDFDPTKSYPLLIEVYGGPWSQTVRSRFEAANPYCEFGFIIAQLDNRGTPNRGKDFEDAAYMKLGIVDIKDQADGVEFLAQREYIDGDRVGITGHSYGGYMAALAVLKFPDIFHVAVAGASVTDWKNYDTIYTERFMRTPQENPEGYRDGSCITYAEQLQGELLLQHGMVDDNVHPTNVFQLVDALQRHNKRFEIMLYPTSGHGFRSPSANRLKWEFLYEHLIENAAAN